MYDQSQQVRGNHIIKLKNICFKERGLLYMAEFVERKPDPGWYGNMGFIIFLIFILIIFGVGFCFCGL
jgi:hypothetical protein